MEGVNAETYKIRTEIIVLIESFICGISLKCLLDLLYILLANNIA